MTYRSWTLSTPSALVVACVAALGGIAWLIHTGIAAQTAIVASVCGAVVLGGILTLGSDDVLEHLERNLKNKPTSVLVILAALSGLYFIDSAGMNAVQSKAWIFIAIYLSAPFLLLSGHRGLTRATELDAIAILWIWLPLELGLVRRILDSGPPNTGLNYAFAQGLALNMGLLAFAAWRRFPGIGYRFEFDRKRIAIALASFFAFALVAIPLGFAIHFIRYTFALRKLVVAPAAFLAIYLFTAIPEEVLFRGLVQNWFQRLASTRAFALPLAALVFGASHLNNGPPIPNYKYFLLATIAGVFYGFVWQRTGSLAASAITHALVDTMWSVFFR
jgi:hypothetical protein